MNYSAFQALVSAGEKANVDFKIECHAFERSSPESDRARAELAKDICAMANNPDKRSFLLIGVADNGKDFKSVTNMALTNANLQTFCKQAIDPPPKISLAELELPSSTGKHAGKRCLIIQIGPHPLGNFQRPFRFSKDFICPEQTAPKYRYSFRKNEVWIRRGDTSDLASPEETAALFRPHLAPPPPKPAMPLKTDARDVIGRLLPWKKDGLAVGVTKRFRELFTEHGVAETQIQHFFPTNWVR